MKTIKALAVAAALAASGVANAAIDTSTSGLNADIIFVAYDFGAQQTFVLDTDVNIGTIMQPGGSLFSLDLDSLANWGSFLSAVNGNANRTGIQWTVWSGRGQGALLANTDTTSPGIAATAFSPIASTLFNNLATQANAQDPSVGSLVGAAGGAAIGLAGNFGNRTSWNVTQPYASGSFVTNLFSYQAAATALGTLVGRASFNGDTNLLTVAAVPEPGTYALMLAGLIAVGAIARKRLRG